MGSLFQCKSFKVIIKGIFLLFLFHFQVTTCLSQNGFNDDRIHIDEHFLSSLKTFGEDEFADKIDSIFKLIDISDDISANELAQEFGLESIFDFVNLDSLLKDMDLNEVFKDTDWNKFMRTINNPKIFNSKSNFQKDINLLNSNINLTNDTLNLSPDKLLKCLSYSDVFKLIDFPCYFTLIKEGKVNFNRQPSQKDMEVLSECIDFMKLYETIDWNCVFAMIDLNVFININRSQIDIMSNSNLLDLIKRFKSTNSDSFFINHFNWDASKFHLDTEKSKYVNSNKISKIFKVLSDYLMKGRWSKDSENIFENKKFGLFASLFLSFHGDTELSRRLVVEYGLNIQKSRYLELGNYEYILASNYLQKDIMISFYLENSIDKISFKNVSISDQAGRNFEIIKIASILESIGFLQSKLGDNIQALESLFKAKEIEEIIINHYASDIPIDSVLVKTYNQKERDSLIAKYGISIEQLEPLQMDRILSIPPILINDKLQEEKFEDALIICHVYKDLLLTQDSLERTRSSFVPNNRRLDKTYVLQIIRELYSTMFKITELNENSNLQLREKYKTCLIALHRLEHEQALVVLYSHISSAYTGMRRYTKSFEYQLKSWNLLKSLENLDYINWTNSGVETTEIEYANRLPIHVNVIANLAIQYTRRKDFKEAERFLNEAKAFMERVIENEIKRSIDDEELLDFEINMFEIHTSLAELYSYLNDEEGSYNELQKCLKIAKRSNQKTHWFMYHGLIGSYYVHFNKRPLGLPHYQQALIFAKQMNNKEILADAYLKLAEYYYADRNFQESNLFIDSSRIIAKEIKLNYVIIKSNNLEGFNLLANNQFNDAEEIFDQNITLIEDKVFGGFQSHLSKQLNLESNFGSYMGAIICAFKLDKNEKAFQYIQQVKARTLNDLLEEGALNSENIPKSLRDERSILLKELNKSQQKKIIQSSISGGANEQDSLLKELEIINAEIRESSIDFSKLIEPTLASFSKIKNQLDKNQAFIEYFVGDSIYAFVVTKNKHSVFTLDRKAEIYSNLSELINRVNNVDNAKNGSRLKMKKLGAKLDENSAEIYNLLFAPIRNSGILDEIEELIIAPDNRFYALPFELLIESVPDRKSKSNSQYLGDLYTIHYYQSATIFDNQQKSQNSYNNKDKLLVLSKSNFEEYPKLLNLNTSNVDEIKKSFDKIEILKDDEVTVDRLSKINLSDYRYLHFSTHAVIDDIPELSYLALTNSQLSLFNTFDLNLNSKVAVLSACQTAQGSFQRGGGVMGFTRALMYAGTESLVISLWPIEDVASEYLFNRFWSNIALGQRPNIALQEAKQYLRKLDKKYDNPFYWAGFVLFGKS